MLRRRHVQFGLVPLENSTDGRVSDTLEMFARHSGLKIRAEVKRLFDPHGAMKKRVPRPVLLEAPPADGPNWGMPMLKTRDRGVQAMFVVAMMEVKARWNLLPPDA